MNSEMAGFHAKDIDAGQVLARVFSDHCKLAVGRR
jgi:hypothetical protein